MDISIKKDLASNWFKLLQNAICDDILKIEKNKVNFESTPWNRSNKKDEGGGEYRILKNGKIFEKVGVNFSKVYGKFPKQFQKNIPGASKDPRFWASGISIVMHMQNPHIPAMHFNTRFICTKKNWFGGGMDVTPTIIDEKERKNFHKIIKNRLKIPMNNQVRSLNIASSVAIVLAESLRQIESVSYTHLTLPTTTIV